MLSGSMLASLLALATPLGAVASEPAVSPIVGGAAVEPGAWPSVVRVEDRCTGTLVHPEVVVYAGHCGQDIDFVTIGPDSVGASARTVATERCIVHPEAGAVYGHDLAACVLAEAVDVPPIPLAMGCVADGVAAGRATLLIGFGRTSPTGPAGIERAVWSTIVERLGLEWVIGDESAGTCVGDSGGPALVRHEGAGASGWWLLAVLSAGDAGTCGLGYYSDVASHVAWLESVTQRNLSACFGDEGAWAPTRTCLDAAIDASGLATDDPSWSSACGSPFAGVEDEQAPEIELVEWNESAIIVEANDDEAIARVELELLDAEGQSLTRMVDEIAPYEFPGITATPAATAWVRATDLAGNASETRQDRFDGETAGCGVARGRPRGGLLLILVLLGARRRSQRWGSWHR